MTNQNTYTVYKHVNNINNKQYIGITKRKPEERWGSRGINYQNRSPYFWAAIVKYGWNNFTHEIIASGLSKEEACSMEIELIKKLKTQDRNFGYNILEGGTAPKITDEVREKMSKAMMGNKNGLGKKCSEEKKEKISKAQKGRTLTEEHKRKLSLAKKGKKKGPPPEHVKQKISKSHKKKPVYCFETNKTYISIQECSRNLEVPATIIVRCCKNKIKSYKGFHFKYV